MLFFVFFVFVMLHTIPWEDNFFLLSDKKTRAGKAPSGGIGDNMIFGIFTPEDRNVWTLAEDPSAGKFWLTCQSLLQFSPRDKAGQEALFGAGAYFGERSLLERGGNTNMREISTEKKCKIEANLGQRRTEKSAPKTWYQHAPTEAWGHCGWCRG